jgi:hypothetical protein
MFSVDRPARGPLFEAYYQLFGIQPFPYHMSSFLWRIAGGLAALWLVRQLWPRQRLASFVMALLFVLYPGYLRWMEGFEDQPRNLSAFLEALSIALTLQAIRTTRTIPKVLAWTGSILTGWAYLPWWIFRLVWKSSGGCVYFYSSIAIRKGFRSSNEVLQRLVPGQWRP